MLASVLLSSLISFLSPKNKKFVATCPQGFYLFFGVFFRIVGGVFPEGLKNKAFRKWRRDSNVHKKRRGRGGDCLFVEIFLLGCGCFKDHAKGLSLLNFISGGGSGGKLVCCARIVNPRDRGSGESQLLRIPTQKDIKKTGDAGFFWFLCHGKGLS